jgi:hypothetical protein
MGGACEEEEATLIAGLVFAARWRVGRRFSAAVASQLARAPAPGVA